MQVIWIWFFLQKNEEEKTDKSKYFFKLCKNAFLTFVRMYCINVSFSLQKNNEKQKHGLEKLFSSFNWGKKKFWASYLCQNR